jgi:alcohol dehydrogenase YqhD (iron-dependent ADH family)
VVLTISAAGSETSNSAVLTNGETGQKRGLGTDHNRPRFALMNPELTYTLPLNQIAYGVVDIMMHTLDRYFTHAENEFTTEVAEALLRVVVKNGAVAMKNPSDYEAMSELMWTGSVSHNGLTGLGNNPDFAVHQLGHELSAMFDVAHGASLSIMWGSWAEYVFDTKPERFARYAEKVWGVGAREGIEKTVEYFKSIGMPTCFSEADFGVQADSVLEELALRCSFNETRKVGTFRPLDRADLLNIYKMANK